MENEAFNMTPYYLLFLGVFVSALLIGAFLIFMEKKEKRG
jgi:hypothetical protein